MIRTPTTRDYLAISLFWLAVSFFWGAMLYVVVQARVQSLVEKENPALMHIIKMTPAAGAQSPSATATATAPPNVKNAEKQLDAIAASRLSWLLACGALVATITQLLFGAISDRTRHRLGRRKPYLIVGVILANIGIVLFPLAQSYAQLFGSFLLIQLFLNVAAGPYQALVPDLIPFQYHGAASAYMGCFQLIGRTGGMVASGLMLQHGGGLGDITIAFLVTLNGLMLVTAFLTHEDTSVGEIVKDSTKSLLQTLFQFDLRGQASFVWVLVSRFVINTGIYTIMPFLQYYLMNCFKLTRDQALQNQVLIGLTVNIAGLAATFPAGIASDRYSKKRVVYFTSAVCITGGMGFVLSGSIMTALISAAIFGVGYGAFQAVDWALVCNVLPPGEPAKYMGLWGFADTVPQIVAPLMGGAIAAWSIARYDSSIGYRLVMFSAIIWFALGTFFIRFVRERTTAQVKTVPAEAA